MGLDRNFVLRQSVLNELLTIELSEDDKNVNDIPPSVEPAVNREHGRDHTRADARVLITTVNNPGPWEDFIRAVLTGPALPT